MIEINKRKISRDFPPYIIAELSANHSGSLLKAKKSIEAAKIYAVTILRLLKAS